MTSHLRRLIFTGLCLAVANFVETAAGSVFLPDPSELDRSALAGPEAPVDLSALVPQLDESGRRFFEIDDMRYSADAVEIDSAFIGNNWPGGVVYYQFNPAVTTTNRQLWRSAAATWSAVATVSFVESAGSGNYIYVQNSTGNNSYVGMIGGQQIMNMSDWQFQQVIAHEIGHALGAIHEHCRPNRGSYVSIIYANVQAGQTHNFDIETGAVQYGAYDFDSIMHYFSTAFSSNGQNTIVPLPAYASHLGTMGRAQHLSAADAAGMAQRYGGTGATHPPNDNFAARIAILNASGSINGTSVGGTKELSEPNHAGNTGGKSIWYSWTAPATGTVTIDTVQSGFDTLLGVYTGSSVGALTLVASNDDITTNTNLQSRVTFAATSGTSYRIAVDGYGGAAGSVRLNWSLAGVVGPANNNFANRLSLPGAAVDTTESSVGATKETGEPNHAGNAGGKSVWYNWVAPRGGPVTIDTKQSNFDTLLAVYTGTSVGALTLVAANDDNLATLQSSVSFMAVGGRAYRIAVDGYGGASGSIALHIRPADVVSDFNGDTRPDLVLFNAATRQTAIWFLHSSVLTAGSLGPILPVGWRFAGVADMDRNGTSDYLLFYPATRQTAIWYMSGRTFTRGAFGPTLPSGYELAAAADFNTDGKPDFLLYNATTRGTAVWFLNGNALAGGGYGPTVPAGWRIAAAADFDRDGRTDWVLSEIATRRTTIWYMNGISLMRSADGPTLASGYDLAGVADFSRDGQSDYLLYNGGTRQTLCWHMNNNSFVNATEGPTVAAGFTLVAP